jgi:hypothetical protein
MLAVAAVASHEIGEGLLAVASCSVVEAPPPGTPRPDTTQRIYDGDRRVDNVAAAAQNADLGRGCCRHDHAVLGFDRRHRGGERRRRAAVAITAQAASWGAAGHRRGEDRAH